MTNKIHPKLRRQLMRLEDEGNLDQVIYGMFRFSGDSNTLSAELEKDYAGFQGRSIIGSTMTFSSPAKYINDLVDHKQVAYIKGATKMYVENSNES